MKQSTDTNRLQAQIDENLKKVFQETLNEEVPDRFRDLLEKLRQKEAKP
ncbi:MAG: transcriptional regulator [Pseudooceanicola sp.]|nr:transcriptional regulator [Pseudooceanicola sp.]